MHNCIRSLAASGAAALWLCCAPAPLSAVLVVSQCRAGSVAAPAVPRPAAARRVTMAASPPPPSSVASSWEPASRSRSASPGGKPRKPSPIWELDLYTRPVTNDQGKKLWELLVTDANGVMRHVEPLPSSLINSRELRKRIQALVDRAEVRPTQVRFFRTEMQAMIGVALSELPVLTVPTRRTYELRNWLEDRYRDVYPQMPGFKPDLAEEERSRPSALDRQLDKMPDALRGDKWVFVELLVRAARASPARLARPQLPRAMARSGRGQPCSPHLSQPAHTRAPVPHARARAPLRQLGELRGPNASVDSSNIGFGNTFSVDTIDLPDSTPVPGLLITSKRAEPLAAWMSGTELASVSADLERGDLSLEVGIDTQYMFARLWDLTQREEVRARREHGRAKVAAGPSRRRAVLAGAAERRPARALISAPRRAPARRPRRSCAAAAPRAGCTSSPCSRA